MLISVFLITGSNCNNDWTYSRGKGGGGREGGEVGGRETEEENYTLDLYFFLQVSSVEWSLSRREQHLISSSWDKTIKLVRDYYYYYYYYLLVGPCYLYLFDDSNRSYWFSILV